MAITLGKLLDASASMRARNAALFLDGCYHFGYNDAVMRELLTDHQFLVAYQARYTIDIIEKVMTSETFEIFGIRFYRDDDIPYWPRLRALDCAIQIPE